MDETRRSSNRLHMARQVIPTPAAAPSALQLKREALVHAVLDAVRAGAEFYLLPDRGAVAAVMDEPSPAKAKAASLPPTLLEAPAAVALTRRQQEILRQVALGRGIKEIAHRLRISPKTVAAHRGNIMERLGIHDLPRLVVYAARQRLIQLATYDRDRAGP